MPYSSYIFFPSSSSFPSEEQPRFFFTLDGVLANFTTLAAEYLDDLQLPMNEDGMFEESMLKKHFVPDVLFDVCYGRNFWENVEPYGWSWLLFEKAYALSGGRVRFLGKPNVVDTNSWTGKSAWVHKNFGRYGVERLAMSLNIHDLILLCRGKQDVLISAVMSDIILWNNAGGSALYFRELDARSPKCVEEVGKRLNAMEEISRKLRNR